MEITNDKERRWRVRVGRAKKHEEYFVCTCVMNDNNNDNDNDNNNNNNSFISHNGVVANDNTGGSVGHHYVEQLSKEVLYLANGTFPSERLMVFSAVVLQRIKKGSDIRRVLDRRLQMWSTDEFDPLIDEAVRCDRSIKACVPPVNGDHFVSVFSRLMLCCKVRAAVHWLSDNNNKGAVLPSNGYTDIKNGNSTSSRLTVLGALERKHPESQSPHLSPSSTLHS